MRVKCNRCGKLAKTQNTGVSGNSPNINKNYMIPNSDIREQGNPMRASPFLSAQRNLQRNSMPMPNICSGELTPNNIYMNHMSPNMNAMTQPQSRSSSENCYSSMQVAPDLLNTIISNYEMAKANSEESKKKKKPFVERAGDWACIKCKNMNFSFRMVCNRCQLSRIESDLLFNQYMSKLTSYMKVNEMIQSQSQPHSNLSSAETKATIRTPQGSLSAQNPRVQNFPGFNSAKENSFLNFMKFQRTNVNTNESNLTENFPNTGYSQL